ncbi:AFG1-like ATPase-domain-containing protein [Protomyces lactucae-debilis]|uniref:AFG1-like ATPase-domain-containing protein n=1 Tax=Protomyces lactucae-debilis TaxID=2754530 RepID=A0A1Y2FJR9_PROLT|nr:AFG1-like ATPase-domain-containing protein [Protomyces lactucae-debilis]ORY83624.1 AFG1-like ATPase-domain-containing protein [Protomyces lactucae-debilis]
MLLRSQACTRGWRPRSILSKGRSYSSIPVVDKSPLELYDARCEQGILRPDAHQRNVIKATITRLYTDLEHHTFPLVEPPRVDEHRKAPIEDGIGGDANHFKGSIFDVLNLRSIFASRPVKAPKTKAPEVPPKLVKGLYLHGDVGCGKTMLMDLFYATLPSNIKRKQRVHFHSFMLSIHKRAHQLKAEQGNAFNAIPFIAAEIATKSSVLCFDEFQVTDIVDAMILRTLLSSLLKHGVVIFTTSNRAPKELYLGGIQRVSFLPCIELLSTKLDVVCLDSHTDYRKEDKLLSNVYHAGLGPEAQAHADSWFRRLGDFEEDPPHPTVQRSWGRPIRVPAASGDAARFTFQEICGDPLSAADYLELARKYKAFIITDIPRLSMNEKDLARRLITLIDSLYENGTKLIVTSEVPMAEIFSPDGGKKADPDVPLDGAMRSMMDDLDLDMEKLMDSSIFTGQEERFAFHRCLSRISQMGTQAWANQVT